MLDHSFYMNLALTEAWKYQFLTYPNPAVGAVVLGDHGEILAIAAHQEAGFAHAEVLALQQAFISLTSDTNILKLNTSSDIHDYLKSHHNNHFTNSTLYTTLAPCHHEGKTPSCSSLIQSLGIKKLFIGSLDPYSKGSIEALEKFGVSIELGVEQEACDALLSPFLSWKEGKPFSFFKLAQRVNGTVDGGIITNKTARTHGHKIRNKVDAIFVGGNTIRMDRPTLDSRFVQNGKNPDVKIYSRHEHFDQTIPLFAIKDRSVEISNEKEKLLQSAFTMIEGGTECFTAVKDDIDWILVYLSGTMAAGVSIHTTLNAKILHTMPLDGNYLLWMKKIKG